MENKTFRKYYLFSLLGVLLASCYPIYMGISVIVDMIRYGTVYAENYPKYIIPYTPIALALLVCVALIPVALKYFRKYALLFETVISTVLFGKGCNCHSHRNWYFLHTGRLADVYVLCSSEQFRRKNLDRGRRFDG